MPVILTATDFSDAANHAVQYACNMATAHNASLIVVHAFYIPVTFNDTPMPIMSIEEGRNIAEESMGRLLQELRANHPQLQIDSHITYGDITDSLQEYAETNAPWLIIIGNSSNEDTNFWPGSNLMNTLKELPYIVVAVPQEASYREIKNVCLACDFKDSKELFPTKQLITLVNNTKANLHILNVDKNSADFGLEEPAETHEIKKTLQPIAPQYHFVTNENIDEGIQQFVNDHNMDWLIVIPHKHSFFEGLLHRSHTKAMARTSHIPLVALHTKNKKG